MFPDVLILHYEPLNSGAYSVNQYLFDFCTRTQAIARCKIWPALCIATVYVCSSIKPTEYNKHPLNGIGSPDYRGLQMTRMEEANVFACLFFILMNVLT